MDYLFSIMWYLSFPVSIVVSFYATMWFLKKNGKYYTNKSEA